MLVIEEYLMQPLTRKTCLLMTEKAFGVDHACDQGVPDTTANSANITSYDKQAFGVEVPDTATRQQTCLPTSDKLLEYT